MKEPTCEANNQQDKQEGEQVPADFPDYCPGSFHRFVLKIFPVG
jgi:hypothetical protein